MEGESCMAANRPSAYFSAREEILFCSEIFWKMVHEYFFSKMLNKYVTKNLKINSSA